jgi:pyruvate dehydrogenase E2 component (dihydrolipoamide acetyltransferase)
MNATVEPLRGIRRTAARQMVRALQAPVFHLVVEVDMGPALAARKSYEGVTVTDILVRACARALRAHPGLNAHYADETVTIFESVNLGVAVDTDAGLTVPVLHGADNLGLEAIGRRRAELVEKSRSGRLQMADVDGATFTLSNLGMFGIEYFDAILNVPQVAILAVGATRSRPVPIPDGTAWRPIAAMTLTCDHRAVDGAMGARFLTSLRAELEAPDRGADGRSEEAS